MACTGNKIGNTFAEIKSKFQAFNAARSHDMLNELSNPSSCAHFDFYGRKIIDRDHQKMLKKIILDKFINSINNEKQLYDILEEVRKDELGHYLSYRLDYESISVLIYQNIDKRIEKIRQTRGVLVSISDSARHIPEAQRLLGNKGISKYDTDIILTGYDKDRLGDFLLDHQVKAIESVEKVKDFAFRIFDYLKNEEDKKIIWAAIIGLNRKLYKNSDNASFGEIIGEIIFDFIISQGAKKLINKLFDSTIKSQLQKSIEQTEVFLAKSKETSQTKKFRRQIDNLKSKLKDFGVGNTATGDNEAIKAFFQEYLSKTFKKGFKSAEEIIEDNSTLVHNFSATLSHAQNKIDTYIDELHKEFLSGCDKLINNIKINYQIPIFNELIKYNYDRISVDLKRPFDQKNEFYQFYKLHIDHYKRYLLFCGTIFGEVTFRQKPDVMIGSNLEKIKNPENFEDSINYIQDILNISKSYRWQYPGGGLGTYKTFVTFELAFISLKIGWVPFVAIIVRDGANGNPLDIFIDERFFFKSNEFADSETLTKFYKKARELSQNVGYNAIGISPSEFIKKLNKNSPLKFDFTDNEDLFTQMIKTYKGFIISR